MIIYRGVIFINDIGHLVFENSETERIVEIPIEEPILDRIKLYLAMISEPAVTPGLGEEG